MSHDESGIILGYIWPKQTRCPYCGSKIYTEAGNGRCGRMRYRYCADPQAPACPGRENTYKVMAIAVHIDRGGDQSEVIPID